MLTPGTSLSLSVSESGNIILNSAGSDLNIAKMIAHTMKMDFRTAMQVLSAVPTAIDLLGKDRRDYCMEILKSQGNSGPFKPTESEEKVIKHISK